MNIYNTIGPLVLYVCWNGQKIFLNGVLFEMNKQFSKWFDHEQRPRAQQDSIYFLILTVNGMGR